MFWILLVLALEAPPNLPDEVPVCRCLEGQPCLCSDCPCELGAYLRERAEAIRLNTWLVVAVNTKESPGYYPTLHVKSFLGDSTPRFIWSYGRDGELWKDRVTYPGRREVIPISSATLYQVPTFARMRAGGASC